MTNREYFVGQRPPIANLAEDTVNIVPETINVTMDQITKMSAREYQLFMSKPGAADAIDRAYAQKTQPAAVEPPAQEPPPTPPPAI